MNKKVPDFFIIGAPKCGTTALSEYLREHPQVSFSQPKEPHYFSTDLPAYRVFNDFDSYFLNCFPDHDYSKLLGEGSATYLFSKEAINNILSVNPKARFVVMIRNPIDMCRSLHGQFLFDCCENIKDFEEAWKKQKLRLEGKEIPKNSRDAQLLQYKKVCSLGSQLKRVMNQVSPDRLHVIIFDDFIKDTKKVYEGVLTFLQLPADGRIEFPKVNEAKKHRFSFLGKLIVSPPETLLKINNAIKKIMGLKRTGVRKFIQKFTVKKVSKDSLNNEFKEQLLNEFESEIEIIEMLLNRDLSHWRNV